MSDYNLGTASGRIEIDGTAASAGFGIAQTAADSFLSVVQDKLSAIDQLGTRMIQFGAAGTAGFGLAINAAANFEQQLSAIEAVSGATESQMDKVHDAALRIGADTSFSATEAASAMEELIKAGLTVEETLSGAADATVALAAAGGVSLPEAATIAANAMNQFNLQGKDMMGVADSIAGAANASAIDVGQFGQSLSQAGAVANLTGMSFDDLSVAIAEMGNAGIKGSDAGTSIKTFLTNLIPTTNKQVEKFRDMGLISYEATGAMQKLAEAGIKPVGSSMEQVLTAIEAYNEQQGGSKAGTLAARTAAVKYAQDLGVLKNQFFDAEGNLKSFSEVQQVLQDSTKNLTREQKLQTLETLFGSDAIRAAAIFAENGAKGFDQLKASMDKVGAADVAATRLDNFKGSIEALKGSLETLLITVGEVFLPIARIGVDAITAVVNAINSLPGPLKTAVVGLLGFGSVMSILFGVIIKLGFLLAPLLGRLLLFRAIGGIIGVFRNFFTALRGGATVAAAARGAFVTLGSTFTRLIAAGKFLYNTFKFVRVGIALLTGPVGIAIGVLTGLALLGTILYKNWAPFRTLVDNIAGALRGGLAAAFSAIQPAISAVTGYFRELGGIFQSNVIPALQQAGTAISGAFGDAVTTVSSSFGAVVSALQSAGQIIMGQVAPAFADLKAQLSGFIGPGTQAAGIFSVISAKVADFGRFLVGTALPALIRLGSAIATNVLPPLASLAAFLIGNVLPVLIKIAAFIGGVFISTVIMGITGVVQVIRGVFQVITGLFGLFKNLITGNWSAAWASLKTIMSGFLNIIVGALKVWFAVSILKIFSVGLKLLGAIWRAGWNALRGAAAAAWGAIRASAAAVWGAIRAVVSGAVRGISAVVRGVFNAIRGFVVGAWNAIRGATSSAMGAIRGVVSGGFNAIRGVVGAVMGAIRGIISAAWGAIRGIVSAAASAVRSVVSAAFNALRGIVSAAMSAVAGAVRSGISTVLGLLRALPGQAAAAVGNLAGTLFNAGRSLIQGLVNGIQSMAGAVAGAVSSIASKIGGFLPGSPIKEGPLKSWNRGGAGHRLMRTVVDGINKGEPEVKNAMSRAMALQGSMNFGMGVGGVPSSVPSTVRPGRIKQDTFKKDKDKVERPVNLNVYNPIGVPSSVQVQDSLSRLALMGVV